MADRTLKTAHTIAPFMEEAVCQHQARLLASGALAVKTGRHTGSAPRSRFIVEDNETAIAVDWNENTRAFQADRGAQFFRDLQRSLAQERVFEVRSYVGPFPVEFITTSSWHAAFAETIFRESFIESLAERASTAVGGFGTIRIWHDPEAKASDYGIRAPEEAFILLDPTHFSIGICGTSAACEIKTAAFSLASYLLPLAGVLPLHASANCRKDGSGVCLMLGASGSGKTALATTDSRFLIGDDEIIWAETGLSNLEGGGYATLLNLSEEDEPEIFAAVNKFGSILENVDFNPITLVAEFASAAKERARGSYKLKSLKSVYGQSTEAVAPENVIFLTADAPGALPALSRLDDWQARYHFLLGLRDPQIGSAAPSFLRSPSTYLDLFSHFLSVSQPNFWLLNTGCIADGESRSPLTFTRRLLEMIQNDELNEDQNSVRFEKHPVFGFDVLVSAPGIDSELLRRPTGPQVEQLAQIYLEHQESFSDHHELCLRGGPTLSTARAQDLEDAAESDEWTSASIVSRQ